MSDATPELIPADGEVLHQVSYTEDDQTIIGDNGVLLLPAGTVSITTTWPVDGGVEENIIQLSPDYALAHARELMRVAFRAKLAQARAKKATP